MRPLLFLLVLIGCTKQPSSEVTVATPTRTIASSSEKWKAVLTDLNGSFVTEVIWLFDSNFQNFLIELPSGQLAFLRPEGTYYLPGRMLYYSELNCKGEVYALQDSGPNNLIIGVAPDDKFLGYYLENYVPPNTTGVPPIKVMVKSSFYSFGGGPAACHPTVNPNTNQPEAIEVEVTANSKAKSVKLPDFSSYGRLKIAFRKE